MGFSGFIISRRIIVAKDPLESENDTVSSSTVYSLHFIEEFLKPPSLLVSCISFEKKSFDVISSSFNIFFNVIMKASFFVV